MHGFRKIITQKRNLIDINGADGPPPIDTVKRQHIRRCSPRFGGSDQRPQKSRLDRMPRHLSPHARSRSLCHRHLHSTYTSCNTVSVKRNGSKRQKTSKLAMVGRPDLSISSPGTTLTAGSTAVSLNFLENLYRSRLDGKHYAIKVFHKSHLLKLRVGPSETAMTDVFREVLIMKVLGHPNIVNLIEVIDDPTTDHFYMVLEYVEGKWVCEDTGPVGSLGENTTRKYLRNIISGLTYLHAHNIVHGDIKPDNLLITGSGTVKIGDFSVSQVFEGDNDELRRSPGTPVFTAPECCLGVTYRGKAADTWAVGVTLYCMVLGNYPFLGKTLQDTYDKIVNNPLLLPADMNPLLKNLLEGLLCKDPTQRMTLEDVAQHEWVVEGDGPILEYLCRCKRNNLERGVSAESESYSQT